MACFAYCKQSPQGSLGTSRVMIPQQPCLDCTRDGACWGCWWVYLRRYGSRCKYGIECISRGLLWRENGGPQDGPLGSFEAAELADDTGAGARPDRFERSTAGPGAGELRDGPRMAPDRQSLPMPRLEAPAHQGPRPGRRRGPGDRLEGPQRRVAPPLSWGQSAGGPGGGVGS